MIIGIGSDLCDIERIEMTLARFGERFSSRCFTETEQRRSDRKAGRAASYAKRFAAKEACAKALGTGLRRGVFWRDMGVVNLPSGQPTMKLTGGAAERLKAMLPARNRAVHPSDLDRRGAVRPGVRRHRGARGSVERNATRRPSKKRAMSGWLTPASAGEAVVTIYALGEQYRIHTALHLFIPALAVLVPVLSVVSYEFVEKPILGLKGRFQRATTAPEGEGLRTV